jgi:hypothetical protein
MKTVFTNIVLFCFFTLFAQAQISELPPLPWHTVNITWIFQSPSTAVERLDMDISIDKDVPVDYFLYISPFNTSFNGINFYAGIQTNINGWRSKNEQIYSPQGKGGIFSRWEKSAEEPVNLEYVDLMPDGLCESAGYEGNFCSVRRPYSWTKGSYTLSLVKNETIKFNEKLHTWVSYEITDKSNNETFKVGRLLFEGDSLMIKHDVGAFVEIYGGELSEKSIPEVNITFACPIINKQETPLYQVFTKQILGNTPPASPNITYITSRENDITVHLSPEIKEQSENEIIQVIFLENLKNQ